MLFGALLVAGIVGGRLARATPFLPSITGFMLAGLLLGPSGLGILDAALLGAAKPFVAVALGLILFQIGVRLDLRALSRQLLLLSALECGLTFVTVFAAMLAMHLAVVEAAIVAAIAVSASPAILLMVARDFGARGPVTDVSVRLVALNNAFSFLCFALLLPAVHWRQRPDDLLWMLQPAYAVGTSLLLALLLALALVFIARRALAGGEDPMPLSAGFVLLGWGLSLAVNAFPLVTLLAMGVAVRYFEGVLHVSKVDFGRGGTIFFVILFVVAGGNLHLGDVSGAALAALAFVAARAVVKFLLPLLLGARLGLSRRQAVATGLNLQPMAGMAIGIVEMTYLLFPALGPDVRLTVYAAIVILETLGPVLTEWALKLAGEIDAAHNVRH